MSMVGEKRINYLKILFSHCPPGCQEVFFYVLLVQILVVLSEPQHLPSAGSPDRGISRGLRGGGGVSGGDTEMPPPGFALADE